MTPRDTPPMSSEPQPQPPHEPRPMARGRLWELWLLWLWLLFAGVFSLMSVMLLGGCSDAVCEAGFIRIWTPLMVAQGVVIVVGAVLALRGKQTALIGLAVISPVLWIIASLFWETVFES